MSNLYRKVRIWCCLGLCLCLYATYVEMRAERDGDYQALCDITDTVSCTAVFDSPYGKSFGLINYLFGEKADSWNPPNGLLGILYYLIYLISTYYANYRICKMQMIASILSNLLSIFLAYLLINVLEIFCIVCVSVYIVNGFCLYEQYQVYQSFRIHTRKMD